MQWLKNPLGKINMQVHNLLNRLLHNVKKMTRLQLQLKDAVQEDPNNPVLWSNLGTVSIQISDRGLAVYAYQRAERLGLQAHKSHRINKHYKGHCHLGLSILIFRVCQ